MTIRNEFIELRKSSVHGWGVFARKNFRPDEIVEVAPYLIMKMPWKHMPDNMQNYVFWHGDDGKPNESVVCLGNGSLYNHSNSNNATWMVNKRDRVFEFYATRPIKKGEEIFISYGSDYWPSRGINPK